MKQDPLPTPATTPEILLHAVVIELRRLNGNIEKMIDTNVQETDEVELKEPEPKKPAHRDAKKS